MVRYNTTIDVTLDAGETERWAVETDDAGAVRAVIEADGQPYDVDIATADQHNPLREFDAADYTSSLPLGVEKFSDTNSHVIGTDTVAASVYVEITNNSGGPATFEGAVDTHSPASSTTTQAFLTDGTGERASAYRDGRALGNNESLNTDYSHVNIGAVTLQGNDFQTKLEANGSRPLSVACNGGEYLIAQATNADGDVEVEYFDKNGERMGAAGYHSHGDGGGGHWKVYTSESDPGEARSTTGEISRFVITEGHNATYRFYNGNILRLRARGNANASISVQAEDGSQNDSSIALSDELNNGENWTIKRKSNNQDLNFTKSGTTILTLKDFDNSLFLNGNIIKGLREVAAQPTTGDLAPREWAWTDDHDGAGTAAWLYRNAAGTLHYFEPTGTK